MGEITHLRPLVIVGVWGAGTLEVDGVGFHSYTGNLSGPGTWKLPNIYANIVVQIRRVTFFFNTAAIELLLLMSTPAALSSGSPVDSSSSPVVVIIISGHCGRRVRTVTVSWPAPRCSAAGKHAASASTPLITMTEKRRRFKNSRLSEQWPENCRTHHYWNSHSIVFEKTKLIG